MRFAIAVVLLLACTPRVRHAGHGRGVDGNPSDVHSIDATFDGYRVVARCPLDPNELGVLGTGSACFEGACGAGAEPIAAYEPFRLELREQIPFVRSGDGIGARCTPGDRLAVRLNLYDWRAVDEAARRVGALLKKHDLGEQVVITVSGDIVRH